MSNETAKLALIPQPQFVTQASGAFRITDATRIVASTDTQDIADMLALLLRTATGHPIPLEDAANARNEAQQIVLKIAPDDEAAKAEGYRLEITPEKVELTGYDASGLFYSIQTLRQLLPIEAQDSDWSLPAVTITDAPSYRWRGLHLDVGRHFFPVEFVKKFLDLMALHKFNIFHWHLTEDQGWRIEIKQYPRLIEVGSKRVATPIPANREELDGKPYSGFYTQAEIKEVVAYAQERFITVVPEIDMPGHMVAALASYPELGCVGEGYEVRTRWGIADDVLCAGNEAVYTFVENVLSEVLALFPSEYIHIGGDECPKVRWEDCPKCQAKIQQENLQDEHELQSYFIKRVAAFLNAKGRRMIGWDEILEGGLAPNATVMSWRGTKGGIEAAKAGHDVVMTPIQHCYLDYYQSEDRDNEPPAIGLYLPLEQVYKFQPTEGVPEDKAHHILGGQGNLWTEYMPTEAQVEYMAYPRACAIAETLWSDMTARDYDDFLKRLHEHLRRLDALDVKYRNPFA